MDSEDLKKAMEIVSKLTNQIYDCDASEEQKENMIHTHSALSFMFGNVLGAKERYEIMLKSKGDLIQPEGAFISGSCKGEVCSVCGRPAEKKLGEEIPFDDPDPNRHNLTAYVCYEHFKIIIG